MRISLRQIVTSLIAISIAVVTVIYIATNAAQVGQQPVLVRALLLSIAVLAAMIALYPINSLFTGKPLSYGLFVCLPALIPGFVYYLLILPGQAVGGISATQLQSQLISDRSSNGIIEVGFSYPIYTPTIEIVNKELFTRQLNVFLRMVDTNNDTALFRAVRAQIPGTSLSVESTVQGMLSESTGFLFLPVAIPPLGSVSGKVVFIISNLDDGTTFTEALGRAYQAQFELRDPETGELVFNFPLDRL